MVPAPGRSRVRLLVAVVLLGWLVVAGVAGPLSGKLRDVQENSAAGWLPSEAESTRVLAVQERLEPTPSTPAVVVYVRDSGITPSDRAIVAADVQAFAQLPALAGAVSPAIPSQDGKALQVFVPLDRSDLEGFPEAAEQLRERVAGRDLQAWVTGPGGINADLIAAFQQIDVTLLTVTALVVVVILLVVYRSPWLWALPLLSVALAYSLAAGVVYVLADADVITLDGQAQGILTVLTFGAGTDYALLLIARYREELHRFERPSEAMRQALRGALPAIAASAGTIAVALLCLLLADLNSNRGLGPVAAIGIVSAFLAMVTLLPALLLLVGRRVFWPRVPRHDEAVDGSHGVWGRVAALVERRSRAVALASVVGLVALASLAPRLDANGLAAADSFVSTPRSVDGLSVLAEHFPAGSGSPVVVVAPADAAQEALQLLRADDAVASVQERRGSPVDGLVVADAVLAVPADGPQGEVVVERLRDRLDERVLVGGFTAIDLDVREAAQRDNLVIIPLVLAVIVIFLGLLLRSVTAALVLVGTVVLSFLATLGVSAVVFHEVLGFASSTPNFPLFAFIFLVALGIDYNIFLMTRVREEALRRGTRDGVLTGLAVTGGVITSAGVVLAATFAALGVLPVVPLAQLGFAVAFGVLLDTLLVRSLLVPALVLGLGPRTWWPSRLDP
jgi:RND superfamily putative drug exporter